MSIRSCDYSTISGRLIDLDNLRPEDVDIRDIAHALSRQCRYAGHVEWYSVAEHSVIVMRMALPEGRHLLSTDRCFSVDRMPDLKELCAHGLLHDAHEAYTGDIVAPLKGRLRRGADSDEPSYLDRLERDIDMAIRDRFRLDDPSPFIRQSIRAADKRALLAEQTRLRLVDSSAFDSHVERGTTYDDGSPVDEGGTMPIGLEREDAKELFLSEWQNLLM